jgi:subtilisin
MRRASLVTALLMSCVPLSSPARAEDHAKKPQAASKVSEALVVKAQAEGTVRVIVQLNLGWAPDGVLAGEQQEEQRSAILASQDQLFSELAGLGAERLRDFQFIPYQALRVSPAALDVLAASPLVVSVHEDTLARISLTESSPLVQADQAWAAGKDGTGKMVAILDTGVDKAHSFFGGRVVSEACYSGGSDCPNGLTTQTGAGSGVHCTYQPLHCDHGTHVAGIAAGSGASFSGVAKNAQIMAVQVFSRFDGAQCGGGPNPCALSFVSDQIAGLEFVYSQRNNFAIASVNMSLGGGQFFATCDSQPQKAAIDNLRSVGIATVIASGNNGFTNSISSPACISTAVSVGSTTKADAVSSFSNSASFLHLLAPGSSINASVPGGTFAFKNGTSMATPHVAGAWAVLKQGKSNASVTEVLNALTSTGLSVNDTRNGIVKPRIRVRDALKKLLPVRRDATGDAVDDVLLRRTTGEIQVLRSTTTALTRGPQGGSVSIPDSGTATPYPSTITVPSFLGTVTKVTVSLQTFTHSFPGDLDVLLVGPGGQNVMLLSDLGTTAVSGLNLTFDDSGPSATSPLVSGTFKPTNSGAGDILPGPAPAGPHGAVLSAFNGVSPVGVWSLYVNDQAAGDAGNIASWSISFEGGAANWTSGFVDYRFDIYYADVDGDAKADLIARSKDTGNVEVYRSTGSTFAYLAGTGPGGVWSYGWGTSYDLYFADVTGDGKSDLIGRTVANGDVVVFPSTGTGFSSAPPAGLWSYGWSSGYDLYFGDVTGDGLEDLVARYFGPNAALTGDVYVSPSTGTGFASPTRWTYGYSAGYDLFVADANGDGKADLATRYFGPNAGLTGDVYVIYSTGTGFSWEGNFARWTYGWGSTYDVVFRDVSGDGKADFIGRHSGNGEVWVAVSNGTAFVGTAIWATGVDSSYQLR